MLRFSIVKHNSELDSLAESVVVTDYVIQSSRLRHPVESRDVDQSSRRRRWVHIISPRDVSQMVFYIVFHECVVQKLFGKDCR